MEVIAKRIAILLTEKGIEVTFLTPSKLFFSPTFILGHYDKILFIYGPGNGAYFLTLVLSILQKPPIIWIATRPQVANKTSVFDTLLRRLAEIYCSTSNHRLIEIAGKLGIRYNKVAIGIDTTRLTSVSKKDIDNAKVHMQRLQVDFNYPIILHVGHLKNNRGLEKLVSIKKKLKNVNVIVVASPSLPRDSGVAESLLACGVIICDEYIEAIGAFYSLADVYVFPTDPSTRGAIDFPLSVIESLFCHTHVITTPFGALPDYLGECNAVHFVDGDFTEAVQSFLVREQFKGIADFHMSEKFDLNLLVDNIIKST